MTAAKLKMYLDHSYGSTVAVHRVLGLWDEDSLTWNTQPDVDSKAEDFQAVAEYLSGEPLQYSWDVTSAVQKWYTGEGNYGLMLEKMTADGYYSKFLSSDYNADYSPVLSVNYVDTSGLESYWTYHSQSAGRAGTGYVGDCRSREKYIQ